MSGELEREIKFDVAFRFDSFQPEFDWRIVRESGLPNTTLLDGISSTNNFDPLLPARYVSWMERLEQMQIAQREGLLPYMDVGWQATSYQGGRTNYEPVQAPKRAWIASIATAGRHLSKAGPIPAPVSPMSRYAQSGHFNALTTHFIMIHSLCVTCQTPSWRLLDESPECRLDAASTASNRETSSESAASVRGPRLSRRASE